MAEYRYAWPASGLSAEDMGMLYRARETAARRTTIARLVVDAVRRAYGQEDLSEPRPAHKEAA